MTDEGSIRGYDIVDLGIVITQETPEPGTLGLLTLGSVAVLRRKRASSVADNRVASTGPSVRRETPVE